MVNGVEGKWRYGRGRVCIYCAQTTHSRCILQQGCPPT